MECYIRKEDSVNIGEVKTFKRRPVRENQTKITFKLYSSD
jgi:hypothetical protein